MELEREKMEVGKGGGGGNRGAGGVALADGRRGGDEDSVHIFGDCWVR